MSEPLLSVDAIDVFYGDIQVLYGLSLEVREGEIVTLLGSNGAGKTTTLRAVSGLRRPRAGDIRFRGKSLVGLPAAGRAELGIALVPEGRDLWAQLTVRENLDLGAYHPRVRANAARNLERVFTMFPRLSERSGQIAGSLSGGEQQMCAIGRALMGEPVLLMLDEPSLGLAPILVDQVMRTVSDLHAQGMTVLLVEQNLRKALEVAQRGTVIETGRVRLEGTSAELSANPEIRTAYLGL
ncbi:MULTISPECIES: ABC transporter ATP-binding protein [Anaeromyxobacter]|uniref:ABC transporter ATP-binding protein n=1 Tax=Anaeromyxobacter TaxID=161492 RepID=UPI001F5A15CB|nr:MULTISPECIES: ABC transporter ATP-binding protein [unclassified Anaeromyxobacter]